jgi:hypothetical protein
LHSTNGSWEALYLVQEQAVGSEIQYCDGCGERVLSRDFESGKAVWVEHRAYCPKCKLNVLDPEVLKELEEQNEAAAAEAEAKASRKAAVRALGARRGGTEIRRSGREPGGRGAHAERSRYERPAPSKAPLLIGLAAAAVIVVVIILVMSGGDSPPEQPTALDYQQKLRSIETALEKLESVEAAEPHR